MVLECVVVTAVLCLDTDSDHRRGAARWPALREGRGARRCRPDVYGNPPWSDASRLSFRAAVPARPPSQAPPAMALSRNWQSSSTRSRSELVSIDRSSVAPREWRRSVSLCSVVLPFFLRPRFLLDAAMSVTAFVVLARILDEPVLQGTIVGALALACAAPTFAVAATRPSSRPC